MYSFGKQREKIWGEGHFKELKIKISILLSFFVEAVEAQKQTILFGLREDRRLMVEFESLVLNCGPKF